MTAAADWSLWSTTARLVVTDPDALTDALTLCQLTLAGIEMVANRFDPDSELSRLRTVGGPQQVSPLLAELISEALSAAASTDGAVDPTIGATLVDLGYDRDITLIQTADRTVARVRRVRGWRTVRLDGTTLTLPAGVLLDLGATAKASAADRCARGIAAHLGVGALVDLGGDIATAGPGPEGGWQVLVHDVESDVPEQITLPAGWAVSTSSTRRRTWTHDGEQRHHLIDPRTSRPVTDTWAAVTAVAGSCLAANTATTGATVMADRGRAWLTRIGLPARTLAHDGTVTRYGAWPEQAA